MNGEGMSPSLCWTILDNYVDILCERANEGVNSDKVSWPNVWMQTLTQCQPFIIYMVRIWICILFCVCWKDRIFFDGFKTQEYSSLYTNFIWCVGSVACFHKAKIFDKLTEILRGRTYILRGSVINMKKPFKLAPFQNWWPLLYGNKIYHSLWFPALQLPLSHLQVDWTT